MERTVVILKPSIPNSEYKTDVITSREIFKEIFERIIQDKGFVIEEEKVCKIDDETAKMHYEEKKDHHLFLDVINYITSDVCIILSISGNGSITEVRKIALSMRDKYIGNDSKLFNLIHASDSEYESEREHQIHFQN